MRTSPLAAALALALAACSNGGGSSAPAGTTPRLFVSAKAPAGGDGSSWASALTRLETALARASDGTEIWIAEGVYRPTTPGGDRTAAFRLATGVALYGGFAGGETSLAQRDPRAHPTVLSGDLAGDDGDDFAHSEENSYQVVVAVDVEDALLDGLTIRGGRADGPGFGATPDSLDQGAGVNVYHGSIALVGCTIERCWSSNHGAINDHSEGSRFVDCLFRDNFALVLGAGLYFHHETASQAERCMFVDNVTAGDGGGAYTRSMHGAAYVDCCFARNRALRGAGSYHALDSATHVEASLFLENRADLGGGGLYADLASPTVVECEFEANEGGVGITDGSAGSGGSGGGGLWSESGAAVVERCTFRANRASFGGGAYFIHGALAQVEECVFEDNSANEAGALYVLDSAASIARCTFERNEAKGGGFSVGGAASIYFADATLAACEFRDNVAQRGGGAVYVEGEDPWIERCVFERNRTFDGAGFGGALFDGYFTRARITNSSFVGNWAGYGGAVYDIAFSEAEFSNCTFASNRADQGDETFAFTLATPSFWNCVIAGERAGIEVDVRHCVLSDAASGAGNVVGAPAFERAPSPGADGTFDGNEDDFGDLRLAQGSLGIDAGWNRLVPAEIEIDLTGAPRFADDPSALDSGIGAGEIVDCGAFERHP